MSAKNADKKQAFLTYWLVLARDLPEPVGEFRFAKSVGRQWEFDWAWPDLLIAVEIDGGNRMVKRSPKSGQMVAVGYHTQDSDYWKINNAQALHWQVFRFTPAMLKHEPERCIEVVRRAIEET